MTVDYDLVIIGGSAVARFAAARASQLQARVALIELEEPPAIEWHTQITHLGRFAQTMRRAEAWGFTGGRDLTLNWQSALAWIAQIQMLQSQRSLPLLAAAGVDVVQGQGAFEQRRSAQGSKVRRPDLAFRAGDRTFWSRAYLLAPPTHPLVPAIEGLEQVDYLTLESLWQQAWQTLPARMVILGGDLRAIGLAQAFNRLGTQVTLVVDRLDLLPHEDAEASGLIQAQLEAEGVTLLTQTAVHHVEQSGGSIRVQAGPLTLETDVLLLAIGQCLQWQALHLEAAGVKWHGWGVPVNRRLQTTNTRIYACGDGLGGYSLPHVADYEATIALNNALFLPTATADYGQVPWALFTDPELAHVGLTEAQARAHYGNSMRVLRQFFTTSVRAQRQTETTGLCKLIVHRNGKILGAHLVGAGASEWIGTIALAMQQRIPIQAIGRLPFVSPTFAEILQATAQQWRTPAPAWTRTLREFWFDLRR